jgi:hypothetical protein
MKDGRQRKPSDKATPEEQSQMRGVGKSGMGLPTLQSGAQLQDFGIAGTAVSPVVMDLIKVNKFLSAAQKTSENGIRFYKNHFNLSDCVILSITDASHAAELHIGGDGCEIPRYRFEAGRMLCLADRLPTVEAPAKVHLLEWSSTTLKRVCRSTLQAGTWSSIKGQRVHSI